MMKRGPNCLRIVMFIKVTATREPGVPLASLTDRAGSPVCEGTAPGSERQRAKDRVLESLADRDERAFRG